MWGIEGEWWILYVLLVILGVWVTIICNALGNVGSDIIKLLTNINNQLFEIRKKLKPDSTTIPLK